MHVVVRNCPMLWECLGSFTLQNAQERTRHQENDEAVLADRQVSFPSDTDIIGVRAGLALIYSQEL